MKRQPVQPAWVPTFIDIDYHKAYSVYCVLDAQVVTEEEIRGLLGNPLSQKGT
jgi:hypothetical protein